MMMQAIGMAPRLNASLASGLAPGLAGGETLREPRRRPLLRGLVQALVTTAALLCAGCPDPEARLDEFLEASEEDRDAPPAKMDLASTLADINGDFFLALAVATASDLPLQFYTTATLVQSGDGTGILTLSLQPLAIDPGETLTPRTPVGDPLVIEDIVVSEEGAFAADLGEIELVAAANPILGLDITTTIALEGFIQDENLFCGNVTGMVSAPTDLDLAGSTFAAVRVDSVDELPEMFAIKCP